MAGNTKLVGFLSDNRVQLERWGVEAVVKLEPASADAMRAACFNELPKRPTQRGADHLADFRAKYDTDTGRVHVNISVDTAGYLSDLLDVLLKDNPQELARVRPWLDELHATVQAHKNFHSADSEPGVAT